METYNIVLGSGDLSAKGTAGDFTIYGIDLNLDPTGVYQVSLIDISFPNPVTTSFLSCFVEIDCIEPQIVGSNKYQLLYRTKPIEQTATSLPLYYEKETGTILPWRTINNYHIYNIRVKVSDSTGVPIPDTGYTILQIQIRRVA